MNDVATPNKIQIKAGDYSALFVPSKGMNFVSLKKGEIEALDQSTYSLFEERCAGLGAMIGPHFHHRKVIPPVPHEERFPHIAGIKAKGGKEPFSHGIGRYAPWAVEVVTDTRIHAVLKGEDEWQGVLLRELEGQDFIMHYTATAKPEGLQIELSVKGETESVIGLETV